MPSRSGRLERIFERVLALRVPILAAYALLVPVAALLAARIPSEGSIDRLVVPSDPDFAATQAFERVFPEGQVVVLLLETEDPFRPAALAEAAGIAEALRAVPGVAVNSALDVFREARPGFAPTPEGAEAFRRFATGTAFFRRQGLVGDRFLGVVAGFPSDGPGRREETLAAIDRALAGVPTGAFREVRRIGAPYVESWIERESGQATARWFPVFGLFVVGLALFLYRSVRSLLAILIALGSAVALGVGAGQLLGFPFTIVSALVPLTVMVTTLASLVYLHSRYVDQPEGVPLEEHHRFALANKFLPVTASSVAAVLGFAALSVSRIRPIREMGIWTAVGLALGWLVAFTLFPALQRALHAPTGCAVAIRTAFYDRVSERLPAFTWRWRVPLVGGALGLAAAGLVALFGLPGLVGSMKVGVDSLDYVDPSLAIHRDMVFFRENVGGLAVARAWIRTAEGAVTTPEVLRGLDRFTSAAEGIPGVTAVVGPTTFLRMRRYVAGEGDTLPDDPTAWARIAADVEQLLFTVPELRAFVDAGTLGNAQVMVLFSKGDQDGYGEVAAALGQAWQATVVGEPAFREASMRVVGESLLQAKAGASLVPTLTESFAITAVLIFAAFLVVFRSTSARLMAMIPSVFAILATFLGMRLTGTPLNVATILIATTVLGTTENDQIHFFHHLQEGDSAGGGHEVALRHALRVSGRASVFATLINAAGFLGLAFSSFPPLRQFGVVTASAFLLAMLADFTALPAALWMLRRARPGA